MYISKNSNNVAIHTAEHVDFAMSWFNRYCGLFSQLRVADFKKTQRRPLYIMGPRLIHMCSQCNTKNCKRDIYDSPSIKNKGKIRTHERLIQKEYPKSLIKLLTLLKRNNFDIIGALDGNLLQQLIYAYGAVSKGNYTNLGSAHCSNIQASKKYGKGRYHYRIYDYDSRIVIETHIDKIDPKTNPLGHCMEVISHRTGKVSEPNHNVLVLEKS